MTIVCPICFVWTSGCDNTDTSASAEIPQTDSRHGDEKQALSRPCRSPAIFHYQFGFVLSVLRPICSISRVPGADRHSSTRRMSGVGRQKEWGWMRRTIAAVFVQLLHLFPALLLSQQLFFSNPRLPENGLHLPEHLLKLIISKLCDSLKAAFEWKLPPRPSIMSHCTSSTISSLPPPLSKTRLSCCHESVFSSHAAATGRHDAPGKLRRGDFRGLARSSLHTLNSRGAALCGNAPGKSQCDSNTVCKWRGIN